MQVGWGWKTLVLFISSSESCIVTPPYDQLGWRLLHIKQQPTTVPWSLSAVGALRLISLAKYKQLLKLTAEIQKSNNYAEPLMYTAIVIYSTVLFINGAPPTSLVCLLSNHTILGIPLFNPFSWIHRAMINTCHTDWGIIQLSTSWMNKSVLIIDIHHPHELSSTITPTSTIINLRYLSST